MSEKILDELFRKVAEVFNISFALDKDKYLTYLFNMADAFSHRGIYGTTIDRGISPYTPGRAIIRRKIRAIATLFSLTVSAATLICEKEIFIYVDEMQEINSEQVIKLTNQLEKTLIRYWDFLCVGFLGHIFNQNIRLNEEIGRFHHGWIKTIKKITKVFWIDESEAEEVAERSITYLLGALSRIQHANRDEKQIKELCNVLKGYWLKESYLF